MRQIKNSYYDKNIPVRTLFKTEQKESPENYIKPIKESENKHIVSTFMPRTKPITKHIEAEVKISSASSPSELIQFFITSRV